MADVLAQNSFPLALQKFMSYSNYVVWISPQFYYKLLELHNLDNIFNIKIASLVYKLKYLPSNTPAALHKLITPSSGVHNYNTRYASKENLYRPVSRTNYGLSRFSSMASRVWEKVPYRLKILPFSSFIQQYKHHLLVNQN